MKNPFGKIAILGAVCSMSLLAACGGGAPTAEEEDTPEAAAFRYRHAVMELLATKMGTISNMAREEIPVDEAAFAKAVNDLAALSGMVVEGFMPEGIPAGSRAAADIWTNWDDFAQKGADLQAVADGLVAAVAEGGFAAAQEPAQSAGREGCGGCHQPYRTSEE